MPHCLATCGGMAYNVRELAVVLAVLTPVLSSRRVRYLNRGGFEGYDVVVGRASSDGLEEAVDGDPYGVQRQAWRVPSPRAQQRRSCCCSARRGAAGAGMAAQD
jgi:hypothetical protein